MQFRRSDLHQFIEKHSKESKSFSKGEFFEKYYSSKIHNKGIPLLVSSRFLREHKCGQIDLAYISKGTIYICEIKSFSLSLGHKQRYRLKNSQELLAQVLEAPVLVSVIN